MAIRASSSKLIVTVETAAIVGAMILLPLAVWGQDSGSAKVPVQLVPPDGAKFVLRARAKGDQIYTCKEQNGRYSWTLKAPEAQLFDRDGEVVGRHSAGPSWVWNDGSAVTGKVIARADSPDKDAIHWVLLEAVGHSGNGLLSKVTHIQRLNTKGGKAPISGCYAAHAGAEIRVPYSATYLFAIKVLRLQGLERVYFKHVVGPGEPLVPANPSRDGRAGVPVNVVPSFVVELLPEVLRSASFSAEAKANRESQENDDGGGIKVRDVSLPLTSSSGEVSLRQIVASGHSSEISPRIDQLWWALYDDGRRSDVWYFAANTERNDHKALQNYEIDSASDSSCGGVALRIRGTMYRPQGAWWITGKTLAFSLREGALSLSRVLNDFGFFHGYDTGDAFPPTDVVTESEMRPRFEIRTYDSVPDAVLRHCGFRDPMGNEFDWAADEKAARCITSYSDARITFRMLEEPSFVERGGIPDSERL